MLCCDIVLWFLVYSTFGWFYETLFCSIQAGEFVSRGFLYGPYLPIYGFGSILIVILLHNRMHKVRLFLIAMTVTTVLEYLTSWLLEVIFHQRWWNYSSYHFNLSGRICLLASLLFGVLGVCLVNYFHPALTKQTNKIPKSARFGVAIIVFAFLISDSIMSVLHNI